MQLWLVPGAAVTIREQLVTQIMLAIVSGDLAPGQRLPSTRQLARRFRVHPNTVSGGYRQLQRDQWVEFRRGSGVYVRNCALQSQLSGADPLDRLIVSLFRTVRELGVPFAAARERIRQWMDLNPPDHFLLVEPDEELAAIVAFELRQALTAPVKCCGFRNGQILGSLTGSVPVVLPSKADAVRQALPAPSELLTLQICSVQFSLVKWLPVPSDALVAIASRWPGFLKLARTMLVAAGFHPAALLFRDVRKPDWQRGFRASTVVVCDVVTAKHVPKSCRVVSFSLLAQSSIEQLARHQEFLMSRDGLV